MSSLHVTSVILESILQQIVNNALAQNLSKE